MKDTDLSVYFPYKLRCEILDYKSDYVGEKYGTIQGMYFIQDTIYYRFKNIDYAGKNIEQFKPILKPLSNLKDEVDSLTKRASIFLQEASKLPYNSNDLLSMGLAYNDFQILVKNHFDVFGLIDKGIAIDINTLEDGTY